MAGMDAVTLYSGDALGAYGFGQGHPFGPDRQEAFLQRLRADGLDGRVAHAAPVRANDDMLLRFHARGYIEFVRERCAAGVGYLDGGDTPAEPAMAEAAEWVVGTTVAAVEAIIAGATRRAMVPIGGLHHAGRDHAAGFCLYNDCGVAIETLRRVHGIERVAYVDIDVHHGDGVFYAFESDSAVIIADIHEDGRFLYPGTGSRTERGTGAGEGTKLNLPLPPGAGDTEFRIAWAEVEAFLDLHAPGFFILQCGADGLTGDPLAHLRYSDATHAYATERLCMLADRHASGRVLALGGGGYDRDNLGRAWTAVLQALIQ